MQACLLIYDIPDGAIPMPRHPCNVLPRMAIRIQLSGWVIREDDIPYTYLQYLTDNGCTWDSIKFDRSENEKLIRKCVNALKVEIRERIRSARQSAANAEQKFEDETLSPMERVKKYEGQTRATITNLKKRLNQLNEAARLFGVEKDISINEALSECQGIKTMMETRCRLYVETTNMLAARNGDSDGMVRAAREDRVPVSIFADYCEDAGIDTRKLRKAYESIF